MSMNRLSLGCVLGLSLGLSALAQTNYYVSQSAGNFDNDSLAASKKNLTVRNCVGLRTQGFSQSQLSITVRFDIFRLEKEKNLCN
jgi:hypothetical protein